MNRDANGNLLKIGDRVKIKKLSEKEYNKIYQSNFYSSYLSNFKKIDMNKVYKIKNIDYFNCIILEKKYTLDYIFSWFYSGELIKINCLKNKVRKLKRLLGK